MFRTHDPDHERLVAVKAFTLDLTPEQAVRLSEQFQSLVSLELEHPCITAPIATGVEEFVAYLAVPYVAGESLDAAIRQYGPAPAGDAIRLVAHVAEALDAAAHVGVFHGSLHPRDILVTPGETHVTGLGVVQALENVGLHGPIRRPYVAPEREAGDEWGAAADVYSLGVIAYEVLTGRRALPGTDQPLAGLADLKVPDPLALKEALEAALDPDPERRPSRPQEFAAAFAAALSESSDATPPPERAHAHRPRRPRSRPVKLPGLDEPLTPVALGAAGAAAPAPVADTASPAAPAPVAEPVPPPLAAPEVPAEEVPMPEEVAPAPVPDDRPAPAPEPVPIPAPADAIAADAPEAGPEPTEQSEPPDAVRMAGTPFALAEIPLSATPAGLRDWPAPDGLLLPVPSAESVEAPGSTDAFPLGFAELENAKPAAGDAVKGAPDLDTFDFSFPPEPPPDPRPPQPTPAFPLRGPTVSRRSPLDLGPPPPSTFAAPKLGDPASVGRGIPHAFEPAPTPDPFRPGRELEFGRTPPPKGPSSFRLVTGIAAGLVIAFSAGYWLGSRSSTERPAAASPAVAASRTATPPAAAPVPAATPKSSPPARATSAPATAAGQSVAPRTPIPAVAPPPSPARAEPPPAAPSSIRGTIAVVADPLPANVFIDGIRDGLTPRNLTRIPLGPHTIQVTRPGYVSQEKSVVLTAKETSVRVVFTLSPATAPQAGVPAAKPEAAAAKPDAAAAKPEAAGPQSLVIETRPPGARARVGGRDVGVTPVTIPSIRAGLHKVELQMEGYRPWAETITVKAGQRRRVTASLERIARR